MSMAGGTAHFDLGQEVHFDGQHPCALTALATPSWNVEREIACRHFVLYGFRCGSKSFANGCERVGIGCGVRAWDAPDVLLIDRDHFIEVFPACY